MPAAHEPPGVNRVYVVGVVLAAIGLAGYAAGVAVAYPGRAFSLPVLMVGIALVAMRGAFEEGSE